MIVLLAPLRVGIDHDMSRPEDGAAKL